MKIKLSTLKQLIREARPMYKHGSLMDAKEAYEKAISLGLDDIDASNIADDIGHYNKMYDEKIKDIPYAVSRSKGINRPSFGNNAVEEREEQLRDQLVGQEGRPIIDETRDEKIAELAEMTDKDLNDPILQTVFDAFYQER